jgi:hypothetical protein
MAAHCDKGVAELLRFSNKHPIRNLLKSNANPLPARRAVPSGPLPCRNHQRTRVRCNPIPLSANEVGGDCPSPAGLSGRSFRAKAEAGEGARRADEGRRELNKSCGRGEVEFLMSCPSPWPSPRSALRGEGSAFFDAERCFLQSIGSVRRSCQNSSKNLLHEAV